MTATQAAPAFFLAVVVILLVCRLVSAAGIRFGQPPVVGEMIAGVLLGPSLLGLVAPGLQTALFPDTVRTLLYLGGQIGLVVFMFGAGYEFSVKSVRGSARSVGTISLAGTVVPLVLGAAVAVFGNSWTPVFKAGVSPLVSASFVGVAMAITAFPMLARIITERGLGKTRFGSLALACGALDDVLAWILLAVVLGMHAGSPRPVLIAVLGAALFALVLATVGRRLLSAVTASPRVNADQRLLVTVAVLFAAAWFTDIIGLYAVFGAFCVGIAFPRSEGSEKILAKIMPIGRIVFLPLFFTYSGLNTRFALLADPKLLLFTGLCVVVAIIGKFGACWAAARAMGEPQPIAVRVGALINARGLMQLIALNVGLQAGIVSSELFTVLVVVALVTTIMTAPVLSWLDRRDARRGVDSGEVAALTAPQVAEI
ncbi:MAG: cation:proton antiporter [Amycolatopsis sp.]|jgi:Kef-type K+ transport system membrane component KefB|uniref:cation:proton antiporter n=1 Tax=Amycolatopsis sp. TaxID=37632 RepID=UPI00262DA02A|nr:cation:proton antiporter [Amycolatopsis sp.]MCU1684092.1 cation:proton antiporter [Amycolatopsis sp.]